MATAFAEKRNFPRIKLRTPVRFQIRGMPRFNSTISDDISLGGLGMVNNDFIAPQTQVMLEINVLSRILRPVGTVAWSYPLSHSDRYRVGIKFLELDPREKTYLGDFIDMQRGKF